MQDLQKQGLGSAFLLGIGVGMSEPRICHVAGK